MPPRLRCRPAGARKRPRKSASDTNVALRSAHDERAKIPSKIELKKLLKHEPSALAVGRAKQVQYAAGDAAAMFASHRSNFFAWVKDHASRPGQPRPTRFYRRGKRALLRFDYQDFTVKDDRLHLPESLGLGVITLVDRRGEPLLQPGDRLVEVRIKRCRSRLWVTVDFVLGRKPARLLLRGNLFVEPGVARLVTFLDDENIVPFFVCGGLAKAILQRGAKWHAKLRSESKLGARHGKRRAGQLAGAQRPPKWRI